VAIEASCAPFPALAWRAPYSGSAGLSRSARALFWASAQTRGPKPPDPWSGGALGNPGPRAAGRCPGRGVTPPPPPPSSSSLSVSISVAFPLAPAPQFNVPLHAGSLKGLQLMLGRLARWRAAAGSASAALAPRHLPSPLPLESASDPPGRRPGRAADKRHRRRRGFSARVGSWPMQFSFFQSVAPVNHEAGSVLQP